MSVIYFHGENGDIAIRGWERANFGWTCGRLLLIPLGQFLSEWSGEQAKIRAILPSDSYVLSESLNFESVVQDYLAGMSCQFVIDGQLIDGFQVQLNTALRLGNDVLRLAARLHGQCEVHAYVEENHREWLASIIELGRAIKFLRDDSGWEKLIRFLRKGSGPVVTSYSVCEQFPNPGLVGWQDDHDGDDWYDLPFERQWSMCIEALRQQTEKHKLEMKPDDWDTFYFGSGWDGYKIADYLNRLDQKG